MPICLQTVAAAPFVVEIKRNCSSAASLTHSCASVALLAPSVSSWSVTACCDVSAVVRSLGNAELMSPAYAVKRYFHSSNWEWLPSYVGGGILYWCIDFTCSSPCCCAAAIVDALTDTDTYHLPADASSVAGSSPWWSFQGSLLRYHVKLRCNLWCFQQLTLMPFTPMMESAQGPW